MKLFKKVLAIFYKENKDNINLSEKQFMDKYKDYKGIDLGFILSMEDSIEPLFNLAKTFVNNCDQEVKEGDDSIIYLIFCVLGAALEEPKETYRRLFSELRLRNVYGYLINLTNFLKELHTLYDYHFKTDLKNMLYEDKFKDILKYLTMFIKDNNIVLEEIIEALDGGWKSNGTIKGDIYIKEMLDYIFDKTNIDSDFLDEVEDNEEEKILLWDEWKDKYYKKVDRIDES